MDRNLRHRNKRLKTKNKQSKQKKNDRTPRNADAEEPDGGAARAKYEGSIILSNLTCSSGTDEENTTCVQSAQNALKAALEEIICRDLHPPLVPPCWVVVDPDPQIEETMYEAGRRHLDLQSL